MGLFTTRQLLGYTEQKVKFRALFLELFFRRTVNFHTEEGDAGQNYRKNAGGGLCLPGC
ncbi:head protein [Escherichia coli]|nr:head protein [Escherichia coli]